MYEAIKDPGSLVAELKNLRLRIDLFTFMQIMPDTVPRFEYQIEMDNLAVLPVSTFDSWWNNQIRSYPRNRARQAEKRGVVLREVAFGDELVEGIWGIYNETDVRQGRPNRHYGKDLATVRKESATFLDQSVFIGAFFDRKLIGFVKLTIDESRTQANLMNIAAMVCQRDKAPTNALIAYSVRACADRGIPFLIYQRFEYGNKGADSMTHFKEINGFQRVDLPRYYIPLTLQGRIALKCSLHHGLAMHLPRPLIRKLLDFRSAWYNRRLRPTSEAS